MSIDRIVVKMNQYTINGFIISKPLQLMVALSIAEQLNIRTSSEYLIADEFLGAHDVADALNSMPGYQGRAKFFSQQTDAYRYAKTKKYKTLFIDSDVGLRKAMTLLLIKLRSFHTKLSVYEEGLGTYRNDLYDQTQQAIKTIGAGTHFGGCALTSEIYVYDPLRYKTNFPKIKVAVRKIDKPLNEYVSSSFEFLNNIFDPNRTLDAIAHEQFTGRCAIYLASWNMDTSLLDELNRSNELLLIKPHPHSKKTTEKLGQKAIAINGGIPAEILIQSIADKFTDVCVYHHNSSANQYININNVKFINIQTHRISTQQNDFNQNES